MPLSPPQFRPVRRVELVTIGIVLLGVLVLGIVLNQQKRPGLPPEMLEMGPSNEVVLSAWQSWYETDSECQRYINPLGVSVVDKTEQGTVAEALVVVEANWTGSERRDWFGNRYDPGFVSGPCNGFQASRPNPQRVQRRMRFIRYQSGWRFQPGYD